MNKEKALKLLGIKIGANKEELKKAYRKKSKENHPDLKGQNYNDKFVEINKAYQMLLSNGTDLDRCKLTHGTIIDIKEV